MTRLFKIPLPPVEPTGHLRNSRSKPTRYGVLGEDGRPIGEVWSYWQYDTGANRWDHLWAAALPDGTEPERYTAYDSRAHAVRALERAKQRSGSSPAP